MFYKGSSSLHVPTQGEAAAAGFLLKPDNEIFLWRKTKHGRLQYKQQLLQKIMSGPAWGRRVMKKCVLPAQIQQAVSSSHLMHYENRPLSILFYIQTSPTAVMAVWPDLHPKSHLSSQLAAEKNCVACTYNLPSAQADGGPGWPSMRLVISCTLGWAPNSHCILLSCTNVFCLF